MLCSEMVLLTAVFKGSPGRQNNSIATENKINILFLYNNYHFFNLIELTQNITRHVFALILSDQ